VSYDGNVFFGVVADRDTVPDIEVLVSAMRASVEELLSAARADGVVRSDGAAGARRRPAAGKEDAPNNPPTSA
jgi:hypothetical protein